MYQKTSDTLGRGLSSGALRKGGLLINTSRPRLYRGPDYSGFHLDSPVIAGQLNFLSLA